MRTLAFLIAVHLTQACGEEPTIQTGLYKVQLTSTRADFFDWVGAEINTFWYLDRVGGKDTRSGAYTLALVGDSTVDPVEGRKQGDRLVFLNQEEFPPYIMFKSARLLVSIEADYSGFFGHGHRELTLRDEIETTFTDAYDIVGTRKQP